MSIANSAVRYAAPPSSPSDVAISPPASASSSVTTGKHTLDTLPTDVLSQVWIHLDQPRPLAWASKRFHALSQDTLWRAKWFLQRYERHEVVFEAIARPRLFKPDLFHTLTRLGAPLSANLLELLYMLHNETASAKLRVTTARWGRISFLSYAAVLNHGARLYNNSITFEPEHFISLRFTRWLSKLEDHVQDREFSLQIQRMFSEGFMPLKLSMCDSSTGEGFKRLVVTQRKNNDLTSAIIFNPAILESAVNNGYVLTAARMEVLISGWCRRCDIFKVMKGIQGLRVAGLVESLKQYAGEAFADVAGHLDFIELRDSDAGSRLVDTKRTRALLLELDSMRALPFRLHEVIEGLLVPTGSQRTSKRKAREEDGSSEASDQEEKGDENKKARHR